MREAHDIVHEMRNALTNGINRGVSELEVITQEQQRRIRELEAVVERLPKTADGIPVTCPMRVWYAHNQHVRGYTVRSHSPFAAFFADGSFYSGWDWSRCYSTEQAARDAVGKYGG